MNAARTASSPTQESPSAGTDSIERIVGVSPVSSTLKSEGVRQLADRLRQQLATADHPPAVAEQANTFLQSTLPLPFVGLIEAGQPTSAQAERLQQIGAIDPASLIVDQPADEVLQTGRFKCVATEYELVAVDVQPLDSGQHELLTLCAAQVSERIIETRQQQLSLQTADLAAVLDLVGRCGAQPNETSAAQTLVNCLQDHLHASQVFIGRRNTDGTIRLLAISGHKTFDARSKTVGQMETVLQESLAREETGSWPVVDSSARHALCCHQQFAEDSATAALVSAPLRDTSDWAGVVVVQFDDDATAAERTSHAKRFLSVAERPVAATLNAVDRSSNSWWRRITATVGRLKNRTAQTVAVMIALAVVALLIPVDYQVHCASELQPSTRRFVAVPFDAPLNRCLVQPGDVVEQGQLLAELDGREVRWELAAVTADLARAAREHDAFLAEQNFGKAAIARHEMERLQNRSALLRDRSDHLEVTSPIAGIVVAGDWKDSEGVPLETGDSLFEVAPLDSLLVEIAIPEDDVRHVQTGMPLQLLLNSMPGDVVHAQVERIYPRAELKDHDNVFLAEARLSQPGLMLKPGMRGTVEICTGPRPLGWNLFHKPWAAVRYWLGW